MARFTRASLLLSTALGAVLLMPPATSAAANGGAAPTSAPATSPAMVPGAAAPGAVPASATPIAHSGGAAPGQRPAQMVVKRKAKARPKATRPRAKIRHTVKHTAKAAPQAPQLATPLEPTVAGVFPVAGPYDFGGADARFGAGRTGHIHQGQDIVAASGTPIVAPVTGAVLWTANQPAAAGIYAVLHGTDGRDYVFMHIKHGTLLVKTGDAVSAGEQIAQVGATGDASGPHLHFEIWIGGWGTKDGQPIDPLPQLQRWAGVAPAA